MASGEVNSSVTGHPEAVPATPANNLLKALQDFVVPLVQTLNQKQNYDEFPTEQQAKSLITALKEFVSSIVPNCKSETDSALTVSMVEAPADGVDNDDDNGRFDDSNSENDPNVRPFYRVVTSQLPKARSSRVPLFSELSAHAPSNNPEKYNLANASQRQRRFPEKLLRALREHVYNAMPIRLLYFEPHGSDIRISLVERDFIYAHLESQLRTNVNVANYLKLAGQEAEEQANQWLMAKHAKYAILSHTWLRTVPGEITYGDWIKERGPIDAESLGYKKLVNFCRTAWKVHGFTFGWIDTICINKESSSELDESIRSMYNWYARSQLCIVYLAETQTLANMHVDPWFTRGWTLQELLAPRTIKFYGRKWHPLFEGSDNDKTVYQIMKQIEKASTISSDELDDIRAAPISRRMQLAAVREVTREEDTAYSLMGIFNVSIMTAYGEGAKRAFFRLLQEILTSSFDILDLLNCAGRWDPNRAHPSGMLPTNPQWYLKRSTHPDLSLGIPIEPLLLTHLGLRVPVILMPALSASSQSPYSPIGDFSATVNIKPVESNLYHSFYNVLDKRITNIDGPNPNVPGSSQITLAVVNFKQAVEDESEPGSIVIPETCFAIPIECLQTMERVVTGWDFDIRGIDIYEPIVFHLKTKNRRGSREVHRDRLKEHGMHLVSVYM